MNKHHATKIAATLALILIVTVLTCQFVAADEFAPTWLKKGTYAEYDSPSGYINFLNASSLVGFTQVEYHSGVFRWTCEGLNSTVAKLNVTLSYTLAKQEYGKPAQLGAPVQLTAEVNVNIYTREVYDLNGTWLGTTHFWLPPNLGLNDVVTLWDLPPDRVTGQIQGYVNAKTPQGTQKAYMFSPVQGTINGTTVFYLLIYDANTGLALESSLSGEAVLKEFGIQEGTSFDSAFLTKTNVDLGPSDATFNVWSILPEVAVAAAVGLVVFMLLRRRRKTRL